MVDADVGSAIVGSYDVGSPVSVKKIPLEYLFGGCDTLSNLVGMIGLFVSGVNVGWFKVESFCCAESAIAKSVLEVSSTHEVDHVLCARPS